MNQYQIDRALTATVEAGRRNGLKSFVIGFPFEKENEPEETKKFQLTVHFQEIAPGVALQILVGGIEEAIKLDLKKHPEAPKEIVSLYQKFLKDFQSLILSHSKAIQKIKSQLR